MPRANFSGKWIRSQYESEPGEGEKFLLALGRNVIEAGLAIRSSEVQLASHFLIDGEHFVHTQVRMRVLKVKKHDYGISLFIDGKREKQKADAKGFGDCTSVSRFVSDSCYKTIYFLANKKNLEVTRTLVNANLIRVDLEVVCAGVRTRCVKLYERSQSLSAGEREIVELMNKGREQELYTAV